MLLADLFPNSTHVKTIGLNTATDIELWDYARDNDYLIVSGVESVYLFFKFTIISAGIRIVEHKV